MTYIKRLVMHGFKSFPRKTELPFTPEINVILGPNGSGKSNVSDALCFVLGRLSIKSMRAAKAGNLIFMGSKAAGPSKEASVEIVFDNSQNAFSVNSSEVSIKRIVRKNGQGIYKINEETKTRQDVLTLLAQAGIDPHGFNIILQGEIQNFVKMHPEERRKIIEEVSGISIYESRKEKSLKELNKTEEKLKEVHAILRERTAYLNNLEKERQQALRYQKLEADVKRYRASIIHHDLSGKKKELEKVNSEIEKNQKEIEKKKKSLVGIKENISNYESKIDRINSTIQKSTGLEQEKLNQEIANLRADIAGFIVRIENYEKKLSEVEKQKHELENSLRDNEVSVKELQSVSNSGDSAKKQKELDEKKKELEKLEEQRKKYYMAKSELRSIKERLEDKKGFLQSYQNESDFLLKQINQLSEELFDKKTTDEKLNSLKHSVEEKKSILNELEGKEAELEKISYKNEYEIDKQNKMKGKIEKIDICPVCKSKITEEHRHSINKETQEEINLLRQEIENSDRQLNEIANRKDFLKKEIEELVSEIAKRESDLIKLSSIEEKNSQIKSAQEKIDSLKGEISELEKKKASLEKSFDENLNIEQRYETVRVEIQEISSRNEKNVDSEISFKKRELERAKIRLKQLSREENDLKEDLDSNKKQMREKEETLEKKRKQEEELSKKFQRYYNERDELHKKVRNEEMNLSEMQNEIHNSEQKLNNLNIDNARFRAEIENLETDMLDYGDVEIVKAGRDSLVQKLEKTKELLSRIGSVNMLSLEVYDTVKKEYDSIHEKSETIENEKEGILKVIAEIDTKKKKTFMKAFNSLNDIFSRNFEKLSTKGTVSLELENRKEPFEGGVNVIVKAGHGKYFDVTSLSGGEQTLVALSLIFAIQEYKPYYFYILDEIDAALDKRNSERLAGLLKKYMQKGQYIVITHNDEIITNATNLYGISMHEGVSKIVSLKL